MASINAAMKSPFRIAPNISTASLTFFNVNEQGGADEDCRHSGSPGCERHRHARRLAERCDDIGEEIEIKSRIATIGPVGIELIQPTSPNSVVAKFIDRRGEGVHAISLKVPDIDEAVAEAEAKGIRCAARVELPMIREAELHPKDTHGVQIELCQYEMEHPAAFAVFDKSVR